MKNHEIPIVAMTAHARSVDQEACLEAGMNDYLTKPIRTQLLGEVIRRMLEPDASSVRPENDLVEVPEEYPV